MIQNQKFLDIEIIIVNDGSIDNRVKIIRVNEERLKDYFNKKC